MSIAIGGNSASKIYLGGDEVSKMYLGSDLVYGGSVPLPYDAEVEYIVVTGNQYITLPVKANESTDAFEIEFRRTDNSYQQRFCNNTAQELAVYVNGSGRIGYRYNGQWKAASNDNLSLLYTYRHKVKADYKNKKIWLDTNYWIISGSSSIVASSDLQVLGQYSSSTNPPFKGIVYGVRYYRNDVLMFDLQPVRLNGVGYLYDKIGGVMYGSETEPFGVGYDKYSELSSYTLVDYIRNTSKTSREYAFINTQCSAKRTTTINVKYRSNESTLTLYPAIFGARSSASVRFDSYYNQNSSALIYSIGSSYAINSGVAYDNNIHTINLGESAITIDGVSTAYTRRNFTLNTPLLLFNENDTNTSNAIPSFSFVGDMYLLQIMENGVLVRYYVPVLHPAGVYGMFDKVENKFYDSATSVAFTGGNDN